MSALHASPSVLPPNLVSSILPVCSKPDVVLTPTRGFLHPFYVTSKLDTLYAVPDSMHIPLVSSAPAANLPVCTHVLSHILTMLFNERQFSTLSDVLAHISDYSERENRVAVYINIVRQPSNIFDLGAAFALGLMHAIKKNKSFAIGLWTKKNVKQLLPPFNRHVKAARLGKTQCEGALKTINKC